MSYVDGFVLAVPKKNVKAYEKVAKTAARIWKRHMRRMAYGGFKTIVSR